MSYLYNDKDITSKRKVLRRDSSKPEQVLWYWLKSKNLKGYKFRRQYSVDKYIVDFYCPRIRLAIEIDGDSHYQEGAYQYDLKRSQLLNSKGIKVLRFTNKEVMDNIEGVIDILLKYLP